MILIRSSSPVSTTGWRARRNCFHHDRLTGTSWIADRLIDLGRRKMFWCTHCQRTWFT